MKFLRRWLIKRLRAEGWHLVKRPEWIERDEPMTFHKRIELRGEVDETILSGFRVVTHQQMVAGPRDLLLLEREQMIAQYGKMLLKALA